MNVNNQSLAERNSVYNRAMNQLLYQVQQEACNGKKPFFSNLEYCKAQAKDIIKRIPGGEGDANARKLVARFSPDAVKLGIELLNAYHEYVSKGLPAEILLEAEKHKIALFAHLCGDERSPYEVLGTFLSTSNEFRDQPIIGNTDLEIKIKFEPFKLKQKRVLRMCRETAGYWSSLSKEQQKGLDKYLSDFANSDGSCELHHIIFNGMGGANFFFSSSGKALNLIISLLYTIPCFLMLFFIL